VGVWLQTPTFVFQPGVYFIRSVAPVLNFYRQLFAPVRVKAEIGTAGSFFHAFSVPLKQVVASTWASWNALSAIQAVERQIQDMPGQCNCFTKETANG
jgi:hypothetical protein